MNRFNLSTIKWCLSGVQFTLVNLVKSVVVRLVQIHFVLPQNLLSHLTPN